MASVSTATARMDDCAHKDNSRHECETANRSTQDQQIPGKLMDMRIEKTHNTPSADMQRVTHDLHELSICPSGSPNPASGSFVHEPLQLNTASIRLVEILNPHTDGTIRCSIRHTKIAYPLQYTCLSYVWGSPDTTHWILMNEKPMRVRQNLWEFLRTVSDKKEKSNVSDESLRISTCYYDLWVDALCIDQTNEKEKNHQVQQMGQIYKGATEVIAWLGRDANTAALFQHYKWRPPTLRDKETGHSEPWSDLFRDLGKITYWNRAWVVQEIVLAKQVYLLSQEFTIQLRDLKYIDEVVEDLVSVPEITGLITLVTNFSKTPIPPLKLIELVELFRHKECKDVRDRIYSVLSISCDGAKLPVNYDSSMVELARSVFRLSAGGVCLTNIFTTLQVLELGSTASNPEFYSPLVGLHRSKMLQYLSPCTHCGEKTGSFSRHISISTVTETRYICLLSNHSGSLAIKGVHEVCHNGHLCLVRGAGLGSGSFEWHLFWRPFDGISWRKLEHQKYIITTKHGAFRALFLSVGLIGELIELISLEQDHNVQYDLALEEFRHRPFRRLKWIVVKQLNRSTTHERVSGITALLPTTRD
jgi:hypothetical protein